MMVAPDEVIDPAVTEEMTGGVVSGAALLTVTLTAAEVVRLPAPSRATAVRVWLPLVAVVVFQETAYGTAVTSAARGTPSSMNCTPTTPVLSEALAEMGTVPETVAPDAGVVSPTRGGVTSPVDGVVTVKSDVAARLPAASLDITR